MDVKIALGTPIYDKDYIVSTTYVERPIYSQEKFYSENFEIRPDKRGNSYIYKELQVNKQNPKVKTITTDYSNSFIGSIDPRYKVIRTFARNYDSANIKNGRLITSRFFPYCFNIEKEINEYDIYNFLNKKENILIGIRQDSTIYLYCLNREKMSDRLVNNSNFRTQINGVKYVKILPKNWIREEFIDELLNENKSIFLLGYESKLYSYSNEDEDYLSMNQEDDLGFLLSFIQSNDLNDLK